jgi:hypothetical protein
VSDSSVSILRGTSGTHSATLVSVKQGANLAVSGPAMIAADRMAVDSSICTGAFGKTDLPTGAIILAGRNELPDNDKLWALSTFPFEVPNVYVCGCERISLDGG